MEVRISEVEGGDKDFGTLWKWEWRLPSSDSGNGKMRASSDPLRYCQIAFLPFVPSFVPLRSRGRMDNDLNFK
jgi:hypothetical protein